MLALWQIGLKNVNNDHFQTDNFAYFFFLGVFLNFRRKFILIMKKSCIFVAVNFNQDSYEKATVFCFGLWGDECV